MSTQSGITAAPELIEAFAQAQQDPTTRALLVTIENEQLVPGTTFSKSGSAAEDFEKLSTILTEDKPCYVAYRLDADADWVLVAWVPTSAPVKAKMLVASTQATLVKQLGQGNFSDQLFASEMDELSTNGWKRHLEHKAAQAPRTEREEEAQKVKQLEGLQSAGTSVRRSDVVNVGSPWTEDAEQAVTAFTSSSAKVLYLSMDVPNETVVLVEESSTLQLPNDAACWAFYRTGKDQIVFIYSCPSGSPVKSRMLFSSNTQPIAAKARSLGLEISKKLETSDPAEVTESYVASEMEEEAPAPTAARLSSNTGGFAKPRRPGRR